MQLGIGEDDDGVGIWCFHDQYIRKDTINCRSMICLRHFSQSTLPFLHLVISGSSIFDRSINLLALDRVDFNPVSNYISMWIIYGMPKVECCAKLFFCNFNETILKHDSVMQDTCSWLFNTNFAAFLFMRKWKCCVVASNTLLSLKFGWLHVSIKLILRFFSPLYPFLW